MYLKTLTIKGFKSFASATRFELEPGITAVVGPNGSGKSNVVDALAWVMGEQGAKNLRGGKMEDVIFAGTSGRPPLGRAEVALTIDNADGLLPIDYTEVTISRTLFRSGGSEYAINGESCRLLDIQELLSDTGMGRQMHVIVGQGQLDAVLQATPEERRGFIEEAAGVLKHRRRKEKTLRKLEAMQANLTRLTDLTAELRRQLKPLGRQAEVARRAQSVQLAVRDAKARLLTDDLLQLQNALDAEIADEEALKTRRLQVEKELSTSRARQGELEQAVSQVQPLLQASRDTWYQLSTQQERFQSLGNLAQERIRLLTVTEPEPSSERDPERLERAAQEHENKVEALEAELILSRESLEHALTTKTTAEELAQGEEERLNALMRAAADRREGLAKLSGQVSVRRSKVEATEAELGRLRGSLAEAEARTQQAQQEFSQVEHEVAGVEAGEEDLDLAFEKTVEALETAQDKVAALKQKRQDAEREQHTLAARLEALQIGLERVGGPEELLAADTPGIVQALTAALAVKPGYEAAISAALGNYAEAVVVQDSAAAVQALQWAKDQDAGQVNLMISQQPGEKTSAGQKSPAGKNAAQKERNAAQKELEARVTAAQQTAQAVEAVAAVDVYDVADQELSTAVQYVLAGVVIVQDLAQAADVLQRNPQLTAVTIEGDILGIFTARGGSSAAPSQLELHAEVEDTKTKLAAVEKKLNSHKQKLEKAQQEQEQAQNQQDKALAKLHESDAAMAAVAEKLSALGSARRSAAAEEARIQQAIDQAHTQVQQEQDSLQEATERLAAAQESATEEEQQGEPDTSRRDELVAAAQQARSQEMDARLALRTLEEQLEGARSRVKSLHEAAAAERRLQEKAAQRATERKLQAAKAQAVAAAVAHTEQYLRASVEISLQEREKLQAQRDQQEAELSSVRERAEILAQELAELTDSVHRDELARTQQRLKIEALENKAIEELGLSREHLLTEYGPDTLIPLEEESKGFAETRQSDSATDKWAALRAPVDEEGRPLDSGPAAENEAAPETDTQETEQPEEARGIPFVRQEQEKRLRKAERELASLGKVNPLALEEFAALEERHQFLAAQLEDLSSSRKDLLEIIRQVDEHVEKVFTEAYTDTAVQFERVFSRLFPGGEGRLVLTDPEDMLTTGIEVEARPAGKKIKRLSLLSGGERSLTAVALLVAIFMARPSPFYVMDEVEAALDDVNLGRLLEIFKELRAKSQLIVITHQKRTMEVADALYGVTMRGDGVTTVISQRLAEIPVAETN